MSLRQGKRRRIVKFKLNEVSGVDESAQEGADAAIIKQADTSASTSPLAHEALPPNREDGMSDMEKAEERNTALAAENDLLKQIVGLSPTHREHYETLSEADRAKFLAKSTHERSAEIAEIAKADQVVYTTADGVELRKSAGETAIRLAKRADEQAAEIAELRKSAKDANLAKRADEELGHLPGSLEVRKAVLAAVDSIADDDARKGAFELLKAADTAHAGSFEAVGTSADIAKSNLTNQGAEKELERLTKARQESTGEDYYTAYAAVMDNNPTIAKRAVG